MKYLAVVILMQSCAGLLYWLIQQPFTIISRESKTIDGDEVYNRIRYIPGLDKDIWLMQQSHHGNGVETALWDRLAIVVDKTRKPKEAFFYQFKGGDLALGSASEYAPFRAPCYSCHVNGPRAIRAYATGLRDDIAIAVLNFRIKTYGCVTSRAGQSDSVEAPFRRKHQALEEPLPVASCVKCHRQEGMRTMLTRDHFDTAKVLVNAGEMPPWPFQLSNKDHALFTTNEID